MNNELERILGEVADGASKRTGSLPVDALRSRGVRRRRTRQAGFGAVGVAAAFGLVFGAAQIVPDAGVGPAATPTAPLPTVDRSLPLGACGSDASSMPVIDGFVWLALSNEEAVAEVGASRPVDVEVQNFGTEPLDLARGEGPYLIAVRDGVVVGFSWPETAPEGIVPMQGQELLDDFGPFVVCEQGELRPSGNTTGRAPLPIGSYTLHPAITLRPDSERVDSDFDWAFERLGHQGTLTVTEPGAAAFTWPPVDPAAPAGACGADADLPLLDPVHPLDITPRDPHVALGAAAGVDVRLEVSSPGIEDTIGTGPYLLAVRQDGVVVGYSWLREAPGPSTLDPGEHEWDDFGPFVICRAGELAPSGDTDGRTPLPAGDYALWVAHQYEATDADAEWAFQNIENAGTLTITAPDAADTDVTQPLPGAVDVELPVCGEPTAGWEFPEGVHIDPETPLAVAVGHTGEDGSGERAFFRDGYGDQLEITFDYVNQTADWASAREIDARAVVVRDGVVVAELAFPQWRDIEWTEWPLGEGRSFSPVEDWVDCASGEHGQVPKGEYEILGWRTFEVTDEDGATGSLTVGYEPTAFTAYDFEDPDNPGPAGD